MLGSHNVHCCLSLTIWVIVCMCVCCQSVKVFEWWWLELIHYRILFYVYYKDFCYSVTFIISTVILIIASWGHDNNAWCILYGTSSHDCYTEHNIECSTQSTKNYWSYLILKCVAIKSYSRWRCVAKLCLLKVIEKSCILMIFKKYY